MGNDEGKHAQYKTALASVGFVWRLWQYNTTKINVETKKSLI
jgi:hypothetical protein